MELITKEILANLSRSEGQNLVSIYLPTHRVGRAVEQDQIRLKNLITQAEGYLQKRDLRQPAIDDLLSPARSLLINSPFWQHQSDGLAVFLEPGAVQYFRLPVEFGELVIVSERFHLAPLLPLLSRNGRYYLLALSQKNVRLMEGSLYGLDEINLEDTPSSLQEALKYDDPQKQLQFHTGANSPGRASGRAAVFHGHSSSKDDADANTLRFLQQVEGGIKEMLVGEKAPLVLAGVETLLAIYKQVNEYPHLVSGMVAGNPDELSAGELHQESWAIVEPIFTRDQDQALADFQELHGKGSTRASNRQTEIIPAAHYGQVEVLFIVDGEQAWGRYDPNKNTLQQHAEFQPGDQDLLNLAAVHTLINGGEVYVLERTLMPGESTLAAVFRYPFNKE